MAVSHVRPNVASETTLQGLLLALCKSEQQLQPPELLTEDGTVLKDAINVVSISTEHSQRRKQLCRATIMCEHKKGRGQRNACKVHVL